jgi:molecular chaperone HtpG
MANLKKLVTTKALDTLKQMAEDKPEIYVQFWDKFSRYIKQGIATEPAEPETLYPLLRFRTDQHPEEWVSLDAYLERLQDGQTDIYYVLGDDERSVLYSPHLDVLKKHGYEAFLLTDPLDSFVLVRMSQYKDHKLCNAASAELKLPQKIGEPDEKSDTTTPEEGMNSVILRFKECLGDRVSDVRFTDRLSESPARLVDPEGAPNQEMQRVYRMLKKEFEAPKKILELNQSHPILQKLADQPMESNLTTLLAEQIYENALLIEGLHPDPASMITRIQEIMAAALK